MAIFPKLREVDEAMTPSRQSLIREVHPEVSFWAVNGGQPILERKKSRAGREVRLELLRKAFGESWWQWWHDEATRTYLRREVALDDLIDAHVALWTAERIHCGKAKTLPQSPSVDKTGLRMEIWY